MPPANRPSVDIEPLRASHAPTLWSALQAPAIYRYVPESPPPSIDALRERYEILIGGPRPGSDERWLNWVMTVAGRPIGTLQATVKSGRSRASIAYVLFVPHWGKGLASEGVRQMIEVLASGDEIDTLVAEIDTRNVRSIALVERLGFGLARRENTDDGQDGVYERVL